MSDQTRFLVKALVAKAVFVLGLLLYAAALDGEPMDERLPSFLVAVGLPLVLGSWFLRLTWGQPAIWWHLRQYLPGATGERLPLARLLDKLIVPPWFLLPVILVFGCLGVATGDMWLVAVPVAVAIGWVGALSIVTGAVLFFAPLVLIPLFVYGVLVLVVSGDPGGLLAAVTLTGLWLVSLRVLPMGEDIREALAFVAGYIGLLIVLPFAALADELRRVLRIGTWVEVIGEGSRLIVHPSTIRAGEVRFRVTNKGPDEDLVISILRTDLRPSALPADLEGYLAGRPDDAVLVDETWVSMGEPEREDLSLSPGRYVVAALMGPSRAGGYARMRATLVVEPQG